MKVVERIFEHRIRQHIEIDDMQFGFMKGKGTTDAIFMARQMQENFRVKGKKLYFGFVDLEKAFDRVPKEVISWAMRKLGVEEWLVSAVMSMYSGAKTVVRTMTHLHGSARVLSHTRTVVRECCKGNDESQWERGKFDPPPRKNPLSDGHQNLCR